MILTEAKKRAQREFDEAIGKSGMTLEQVRTYLDAHPAMKRATYRVPHMGCAGQAANLVLHVAQKAE